MSKQVKAQSHDREAEIAAFLDACGWGGARRENVPGDASTRRYERLTYKGQPAVLMDAPKSSEAPSEPVGATIETRRKLGYNATARLAGGDMTSFAALSQALIRRGFSAPKIIAADLGRGFLLLEDFGRAVFAPIIEADPAQEAPLYKAAIDTLAAIYRSSFPPVLNYGSSEWRVRDYDETALCAEMDLCLDWYAKGVGREIKPAARSQFFLHWRDAFKALEAHKPGLALRDFHAENLFWLPERDGNARVGLIDFQDALFVHPAYDVASLIEDIRRDVSSELSAVLLEEFCDKSGLSYDADFLAAYAVMGGQRNTKLLGFPVRAELKFGKPQYMALMPRVKRHFKNSLQHDIMTDIYIWFENHLPEALEV